MASSQRLSCGFHRLALFLAAIPLLIGLPVSVLWALSDFNHAAERHQKLVCAHKSAGTPGQPWTIPWDAFAKGHNPFSDLIPIDNREISLKHLGCSDFGI